MSKTKTKVLAILMSVVLAFSMTSAAALSAFAAGLTAGVVPQATGQIVYDSVYGVVGGKYALMMKSVVSEREYHGRMMEFTDTLTDVMRSDGTVMVRTSNEPLGKPGIDGTEVIYDIEPMGLYQDDFSNGYVKLVNKQTGKAGVKNLENDSWLVACEYDVLRAIPDGNGFFGLTFGDNSVEASLFGKDGSPTGTFEILASKGTGSYRGGYANSMTNGWISIEAINYGNSGALYLKRAGDGYEIAVPDAKRVLALDDAGNMLIQKMDGDVCYRFASGQEAAIAESGEYTATSLSGELSDTFALVEFFDDSNDNSYYRALDFNSGEIVAGNRVLNWTGSNGLLLAMEDGNVSAITADGDLLSLEVSSDDAPLLDYGSFTEGFICLSFYDEVNYNSFKRYYSAKTGRLLDLDGADIETVLDGYLLATSEEEVYYQEEDWYGEYTRYAIYDGEGEEVAATNGENERLELLFDGHYAKITELESDDPVSGFSYAYEVAICSIGGAQQTNLGTFSSWPSVYPLEESYIEVITNERVKVNPQLDDEDDAAWKYLYYASIYRMDGSLAKELGQYPDFPDVGSIVDYYDGAGEEGVIIGYEVEYEDADGSRFSEYYDTSFNKLDARPEPDHSDNPGDSSGGRLVFGSTVVRIQRDIAEDHSTGAYEIRASVTNEQGKPIMANGYVLGIAGGAGDYMWYNNLKHGSADVWWATNSAGKWGAINSKGAVVIPFDLESYYDAGYDGTNLVMVKKSGIWGFYDYVTKSYVPSGRPIAPTPSKTTPSKGIGVGKTATVGGITYKALNNASATVAFQKAPKAKKKVTVPKTVTINGKSYKVAGISKNAFKGTKAKTVTVKTAMLTKKSVKGCFKGSKVKTVKVSVGNKKANKAAVKKYKKIFTKANCGAKVKVK